MLKEQDHPEEAEAAFLEALQLNPQDDDARYHLYRLRLERRALEQNRIVLRKHG